VSRFKNNTQREIENGLEEIHQKKEWIRCAKLLSSFIVVTESDWLKHGHMTPEEWLCVNQEQEYVETDDEYDDEIFDGDDLIEELEAYDEGFSYIDGLHDWDWEPTVDLFAGQFYSSEDVQLVREYLAKGL